jgi:hypothetical protein
LNGFLFMHTIVTYLEIAVELEYAVLPGAFGSRDAYGALLEPESPPEIELAGARAMIGAEGVPLRLEAIDRRQREAWKTEIEEALREI